MKKIIVLSTCLLLCACSTLNDSVLLGAGIGAATGAAAMSAASNSLGRSASSEDLTSAAVVGLAAGLITSYFIHKNVETSRNDISFGGPDMHFGDLPPSPFIMPANIKKKGGK